MLPKLTKKQFRKRKTLYLAHEIHKALLEPDVAKKLTMKETSNTFPKVSHYKANDTGVVKVGLSLRGIRKLVKKYPLITVEQTREYFGLDPIAQQGESI